MRQRYILSKAGPENSLIIREYAVIGKDAHKIQGIQFEDDYTFICEENYNGDSIQEAISDGHLIATLRTDNLFPVGLLAAKLAQSVVSLYLSSGDCSAELSFNDIELFSNKQ